MSERLWELMFTSSLFITAFLLGAIFGAYLVTRRDKKILEYFRDEVLTDEQNDDIIKEDTLKKIFRD